ncbi:MAG: DnaA/Hda family protein [Candidatus Nitrotoga sp.]
MKQLALNISPDWLPTLDNFVVGRNVEVISILRHVLVSQASGQASERCLTLWGESGSGKSHLLRAIVQQAQVMGLAASYVATGKNIDIEQIADATQAENLSGSAPRAGNSLSSAELEKLTPPKFSPVIAIDDVEKLDGSAQIQLFALYNRQRENNGTLIISCNTAPAHLMLRDDLRTRLGWGLVYQVQRLNDEEKGLALEQHAQASGLRLSHEVIQCLLRHGRRDLPALLTVLDKLDEHCLRLQRAPSVPLLKEVMQHFPVAET